MSRAGGLKVIFLHGFVSSPESTKARYFAERFKASRANGAHGIDFRVPDFNQPAFRTMTITRMLEQLSAEIDLIGPPVTLMGSSLGGTLGVLAAERMGDAVDRLILFAPAVMMSAERHVLPLEGIAEWRRRGEAIFQHYGYNEERALDYAFYEDSLKYRPLDARFTQPTLIYQGTKDDIVDPALVETFASRRPNVALTLVDDGHQLTASLPLIWAGVEKFLGLPS